MFVIWGLQSAAHDETPPAGGKRVIRIEQIGRWFAAAAAEWQASLSDPLADHVEVLLRDRVTAVLHGVLHRRLHHVAEDRLPEQQRDKHVVRQQRSHFSSSSALCHR